MLSVEHESLEFHESFVLKQLIRLIRLIRVQKNKISVRKDKVSVQKNKNPCSKRQDPCSMYRITCHTCNLCVCARTHPRARMRIFYKVN